MSGAHARCSASSADRWIACPGSINASKGRNSTSAAAAEGTFAHDIGAKCLADQSISPSDFLCQKKTIDGREVECGLEMVEGVRVYLDAVDEDLKEGDLGWIEMPLLDALKKVDKDCGGTADYVRYRPSTKSLRVFDFKYGAGVYVEADDNTQMKIYALGALLEVGKPCEEIEVTICQPRFEGAAPVRGFKFRAVVLLDFMDDLRKAAEKTRQKDAPLVAGDHCKFCPAARDCPELEKRQHALVALDFEKLAAVPLADLATALVGVPLVKARIKALEEFAYAEALKGAVIPGFKLVDKRPQRRWKSEGDVVMWAQAQAIDPYAPREVISPAQMDEKLKASAPRGKKKDAVRVIEHLYEKVSSGTALVPESDDRPPAKVVTATDFPSLV